MDGINPSFTRALKSRVSEDDNYENFIAHLKTTYDTNFSLQSLIYNMFVVPIAFNKEHRNMLAYAKKLMGYSSGVVAIDPKHTKLITLLRTAVEKGEGTLDMEATSHDFWMHFECPCSIGLATSPFPQYQRYLFNRNKGSDMLQGIART